MIDTETAESEDIDVLSEVPCVSLAVWHEDCERPAAYLAIKTCGCRVTLCEHHANDAKMLEMMVEVWEHRQCGTCENRMTGPSKWSLL